MTSDAKKRASAKYDETHTTQVKLKLNKVTDADILRKLQEVEKKQTYIKELIRKDIGSE